MILESGNMWKIFPHSDLFCITTNSHLTLNGELVMGRGIAFEAKQKLPQLPRQFGTMIRQSYGHLGRYGLLILKRRPRPSVAAFQVKRHFSDAADLSLIEFSVQLLADLALKYPSARFDLNFPGIGNGRLSRAEVLPIVLKLPDNVHVWERSACAGTADRSPQQSTA